MKYTECSFKNEKDKQMKKYWLSILFLFISLNTLYAQGTIKGLVTDAETNETLIGANVVYSEGKGVVTNYVGAYSINVPNGKYTITVSYVGYENIKRTLEVNNNTVTVDFALNNTILSEIDVVANIAISRETPVAFSNITPEKLQSELAGQDLPMILNSTPGVYATQQGGGDGDARITIRGFNQRNVAVMIDGIPVNDMENGWVYWSNWFGLDIVTQSIQVQRGLGASKLAIPSVGGTMNIITKGIQGKRGSTIKQEVDSQGKIRTSFGYNSGMSKKGWGITGAFSYKEGEGWVNSTNVKGYFGYIKANKTLGKHTLSLSGMIAPQNHQQRRYKKYIATYDSEFAANLGVDVSSLDTNYVWNKGLKYNVSWGDISRNRNNVNAPSEKLSANTNFYTKPVFNLRDFWAVNDNFYISNMLYLSLGNGGGTESKNSLGLNDFNEDGQINWQRIYDANIGRGEGPFGEFPPDENGEYKSTQYLIAKRNNHIWYGLLSTFDYQKNEYLNYSGGIDLRNYQASHYEEVYDLLGGDYVEDNNDPNQVSNKKRIGDKISYSEDSYVKWGGLFGQVEYKKGVISTFLNLSASSISFKRQDYFALGYEESDWKSFSGYTAKSGLNYNINESSNVFINIGFISKVRQLQQIFIGYTTEFRDDIENEYVKAFELGYSYSVQKLAVNFNSYYTRWENRAVNNFSLPDDQTVLVPGLDALHAGLELDFNYKPHPKIDLQGLASIGNWTWDSTVKDAPILSNGQLSENVVSFDTKGVHVGDAAQIQYGASVSYNPIKKVSMRLRYTHFDKNYADYNPNLSVNNDLNDNTFNDSWKIPAYGLTDFHTTYRFKLKKTSMAFRFSMLNVFNVIYISDALSNDKYLANTPLDFGPSSASVFFGQGRRFNTSLQINL